MQQIDTSFLHWALLTCHWLPVPADPLQCKTTCPGPLPSAEGERCSQTRVRQMADEAAVFSLLWQNRTYQEVQRDTNGAKINMNMAQSLISPVLEYASSFERFDYSLVYISLTLVCLPGYQATTVWWRADVMYRMPSTLTLFPGNEQKRLAQVLYSHIMFPSQPFWWMIWTKAKIIRPTLTICLGINSMYTQRSVEAHILGFVCFQVPMAFRKKGVFVQR